MPRVTLTNFTPSGDQVARVDVNGNAPDAHEGSNTRLGLSSVEAPAMFRRGNTYYLTMSDLNCAYCTGTAVR